MAMTPYLILPRKDISGSLKVEEPGNPPKMSGKGTPSIKAIGSLSLPNQLTLPFTKTKAPGQPWVKTSGGPEPSLELPGLLLERPWRPPS